MITSFSSVSVTPLVLALPKCACSCSVLPSTGVWANFGCSSSPMWRQVAHDLDIGSLSDEVDRTSASSTPLHQPRRSSSITRPPRRRSDGLNFYLDHDRIHVGDIATTAENAFTACVIDRSAGLDAIMLAPSRKLVAELNRRARAHRLDHSEATAEVLLADGNQASVGDVITPSNLADSTPQSSDRSARNVEVAQWAGRVDDTAIPCRASARNAFPPGDAALVKQRGRRTP